MERTYAGRPVNFGMPTGDERHHTVRNRMLPKERLDLKALRIAVHGWWLGNPLVYKPGAADLCAVARELASAGAASGTLVLSDTRPDNGSAVAEPHVARHDIVQAVLILRSAIPRPLLGMAAALAVAEIADGALDHFSAVQWPWDVICYDDSSRQHRQRLCHVVVEEEADVAFVSLRLALGRIWAASATDGGATASLLARPDWREVFLAKVLHALDGRLRSLMTAEADSDAEKGKTALFYQEWQRRLMVPARVIVFCGDGTRHPGTAVGIACDGALQMRRSDHEQDRIRLADALATCGIGPLIAHEQIASAWDANWG